jgi:hypothetical protein
MSLLRLASTPLFVIPSLCSLRAFGRFILAWLLMTHQEDYRCFVVTLLLNRFSFHFFDDRVDVDASKQDCMKAGIQKIQAADGSDALFPSLPLLLSFSSSPSWCETGRLFCPFRCIKLCVIVVSFVLMLTIVHRRGCALILLGLATAVGGDQCREMWVEGGWYPTEMRNSGCHRDLHRDVIRRRCRAAILAPSAKRVVRLPAQYLSGLTSQRSAQWSGEG